MNTDRYISKPLTKSLVAHWRFWVFKPSHAGSFSFFSTRIFNMTFQSEREKNNTMRIIRVNSCPFVVINKLTRQVSPF
ncbi:MAG: hypothetical protein CSA81_07240 [Acidobacteria bacterium]|nr:MAG: hypothetical protein CSA81_07240 [Acidobacteriota bacterium]